MIRREPGHARVYRALLRVYPAAFRERFGDEMVQLFGDQLRVARADAAPAGAARTWLRAIGDLAVTAASERARKDRSVAHSLALSPSTSSRVLGLAGILGGAVLLAAFLVDISAELNLVRLLLFNVGAMALAVAVHQRQATASRTLSLAVTVATVAANGWYIAMLLFGIGRPQPPEGDPDFRLIFFFAGVALWLADTAFAVVTLRLGVVSRLGALALAIGSVLAITGMDRLELTTRDNPTIFLPLSLLGIILNGLGWILIGLDVATRRRLQSAPPGARP
jgi:hypothetical protein